MEKQERKMSETNRFAEMLLFGFVIVILVSGTMLVVVNVIDMTVFSIDLILAAIMVGLIYNYRNFTKEQKELQQQIVVELKEIKERL